MQSTPQSYKNCNVYSTVNCRVICCALKMPKTPKKQFEISMSHSGFRSTIKKKDQRNFTTNCILPSCCRVCDKRRTLTHEKVSQRAIVKHVTRINQCNYFHLKRLLTPWTDSTRIHSNRHEHNRYDLRFSPFRTVLEKFTDERTWNMS